MIDKLSRGNMTFARDIDQRREKLGKELPKDYEIYKQLDKNKLYMPRHPNKLNKPIVLKEIIY